MKNVHMKLKSSAISFPLPLLHVAGWFLYVVGDYADHMFAYDVYYAVPSVGSGLAAYILTGFVAILASKMSEWRLSFQVPVFLLALYIASILWHKIWISLHEDSEAEIIVAFQKIPNLSFLQWIETGYVPLLLFLSWAGLYVGSKMYVARLEQQDALFSAILETKRAQLHTLRYQLNPHFLFNSLNSVDVSVQSGDKDTAHRMIQLLTRFLRRSLEQGEQDKIPFRQEVALIKDFVSIEELRFGGAVQLETKIEPECEEILVPPMILQPLIENAIKFAWNQSDQGKAAFTAQKRGKYLFINIVNSKSGDQSVYSGTGTGLRNTQERLEILYGEDTKLDVIETATHFGVELSLPWEEAVFS